MEKEKNKPFVGYQQLQAIISEILAQQQKACSGRGFPSWDFVNGVLSCEEILGEFELWFHWGHLLIVPSKDKDGKKAIDFQELAEWNTMLDGRIVLLGKKWSDEI